MKALKKIGEGILLFLALDYLCKKSGYIFHDLLGLLPVEFITYNIPHRLKYYKVGAIASAIIAGICVYLEWKRENRKVSFLTYCIYLMAPFVAAFCLFLITAFIVSSIEPTELELQNYELSTNIIPMRLVFIGYILFPIAHYTLNRIKGRSSRGDQLHYGSAFKSKQMDSFLALLISFILFSLGFTLDSTVEVWPNYFQSLVLGIFFMILCGIGWIYLLPWPIIICCLYEWRKWKRYRTIVILVPYIFIFIFTVSSLVTSLSDPHQRFRRFALFELPNNLKNFRWHFSGGLGSNYRDTYYFRCSPDDTETIINGMGFEKFTFHIVDCDEYHLFLKRTDISIYHYWRGIDCGGDRLPVNPPLGSAGWPDVKDWGIIKCYRATGKRKDENWYYILMTNESKDEVYIRIGGGG